ncbi:MAG: exopolysaccharide biosynthesis protein [Oleiphilaceae bacterium]|nr:exopolysaccharide biosynthesis protein [Oleiphilaceae bacterium]
MTSQQNDPHAAQTPLFAVPAAKRSRTSDVLLELAEQCLQPTLTLRSMTERLGDRTFGMLLVLLAIFNIVPFVSLVAGLLIVSLGLQMAFGLRRVWLPKAIMDRALPQSSVRKALLAFEPRVRKIERYVRPRWHFTEAPIVDRINGFVIALLGAVITLPLPLTNLGPALVVVLMGLGLLERDGLVQLGAALLGIGAMLAVYVFLFTA